jgi:hypothetical protein
MKTGDSSLYVFHNAFLTLAAVALGRLVTDAANPGQDFWPVSNSLIAFDEVDERPFQDVRNSLNRLKDTGLRAKVTKFISGDVASRMTSSGELIAPKSKVYSLLQPKLHFQRMCKDNATRGWIEEALKHSPIFLIVGMITVTQAAVDHGQQQATQVSGSVNLSISDVASSGTSTVIPSASGDALEVSVGGARARQMHSTASFIAPGERVIGVQYRKVKFRLFSSNKVESSFLENNPNRWVVLFGGDRSGSDDIIEADLQDDLHVDDLELGEVGEVVEGQNSNLVFID